MISCEKARLICDKAQYKEASFLDKMKLKFHLLICKTCAKHSKRNTEFTSLCNKAILNNLPKNEKVKMKDAFKNQLK